MASEQGRAVIYARQSSGKAKSIRDQVDECTEDVGSLGWSVAAVYEDGTSASRFAERTRDAWPRVVTAIERAEFDCLVLWESSRGDRDAETWLGLLRRCREAGVAVRVTSAERTYNLRIPRDWKELASDGIDSAYESEKLSLRTRRGVAAAARSGRPPAGFAPYGYRRSYDPRTGALIGQEPDPDTAPIVIEIISNVARSVPLVTICRDLNARGIPAPMGGTWRRMRIRDLATNPAFIGLRKHKDKTHPAGWPALVDEATFYAAQRVLNEPARMKTARPGRQVHLLSYLAVCDKCDAELRGKDTSYICPNHHVSLNRAKLDNLITELVLGRLAAPDIYGSLVAAGEDADRAVVEARNTVAELRARLDTFRLRAARGETSPETLAFMEAEITREITAAEKRITAAAVPSQLREFVGPDVDVAQRWAGAPVTAKRNVVRALLRVRVRPSGQNAFIPVHERVQIDWI